MVRQCKKKKERCYFLRKQSNSRSCYQCTHQDTNLGCWKDLPCFPFHHFFLTEIGLGVYFDPTSNLCLTDTETCFDVRSLQRPPPLQLTTFWKHSSRFEFSLFSRSVKSTNSGQRKIQEFFLMQSRITANMSKLRQLKCLKIKKIYFTNLNCIQYHWELTTFVNDHLIYRHSYNVITPGYTVYRNCWVKFNTF